MEADTRRSNAKVFDHLGLPHRNGKILGNKFILHCGDESYSGKFQNARFDSSGQPIITVTLDKHGAYPFHLMRSEGDIFLLRDAMGIDSFCPAGNLEIIKTQNGA